MTDVERAFHDAILRRHFDFFLRRCLMTLNPGSRVPPELAHSGDRASARADPAGRDHETDHQHAAAPSKVADGLGCLSRRFCSGMNHGIGSSPSATAANSHRSTPAISARSSNHHGTDARSPKMRISRSLEDEVWTTDRGFRRSTSVYGTLTGLGRQHFHYRRSPEAGRRAIGHPAQPPQSMGLQHADVAARQQGDRGDHCGHATRAPE